MTRYFAAEWNMLIKSGRVKDDPDGLILGDALMFGQFLKNTGLMDGKRVQIVGWAPPNSQSYVEIREI